MTVMSATGTFTRMDESTAEQWAEMMREAAGRILAKHVEDELVEVIATDVAARHGDRLARL